MVAQNGTVSAELYRDPSTLQRLKERDPSMQKTVWAAEKSSLEAVARSILRSEADAEQIVSDLFTDFFFHYVDGVRVARSIPAYLQIMARRRSLRFRKRLYECRPLKSHDHTHDPTNETTSSIDKQRLLKMLEFCLSRLTSRARKILKLRYGHDQSYSVIARQLGNSKQAVGKTVKKSLTALQTCIEDQRRADSPSEVIE